MSKIETPKQFCDRVPRELGLVDFNSFEARRHLEGRLTERDIQIAKQARNELLREIRGHMRERATLQLTEEELQFYWPNRTLGR